MNNDRSQNLKESLTTTLALIFIGACAAMIYIADQAFFEDHDISPLYRSTLDKSYSRFRESDVQVAAGRSHQTNKNQTGDLIHGEVPSAAPKEHDHDSPLFKKAGAALIAKDYELAIKCFDELIVEDRDCITAKHGLADAYNGRGDWQLAINQYRELLQIQPDKICCFEHIGDIFKAQGQDKSATEMYANVVEGYRRLSRRPGSTGANGRYQLALAIMRYGTNADEAVTIAESLVAESATPHYFGLLARSYESVGRIQDAIQAVNRIETADANEKAEIDRFRKNLASKTTK